MITVNMSLQIILSKSCNKFHEVMKDGEIIKHLVSKYLTIYLSPIFWANLLYNGFLMLMVYMIPQHRNVPMQFIQLLEMILLLQ